MENTLDTNSCNTCHGEKNCNCPHHKAIPVFIVLIAFTFLLQAWDILSFSTVDVIWPILLAAIGLTKLGQSRCTCC